MLSSLGYRSHPEKNIKILFLLPSVALFERMFYISHWSNWRLYFFKGWIHEPSHVLPNIPGPDSRRNLTDIRAGGPCPIGRHLVSRPPGISAGGPYPPGMRAGGPYPPGIRLVLGVPALLAAPWFPAHQVLVLGVPIRQVLVLGVPIHQV
jgi:hypothetical protein